MRKELKKSITVILILLGILLTLVGCGDKEENTNKNKDNKTENNTTVGNTIANNTTNGTNSDDTNEITSELPEGSCLFVTNVIDNGETYTLEGVIYEEYIVTKDELGTALKSGKITIDGEALTIKQEGDDDIEMYELCVDDEAHYSIRKHEDGKYHLIRLAQISTCQRKTDIKKQITVNKGLKCENLYTEEEMPVIDKFKNFEKMEAPDNTHPTPSYTFEFKNGSCTKVLVDTGI